MIPHWVWTVWAGAVVAVIVWGLTLEFIAIADGNPHDTLSFIFWEHLRLPSVVLFLAVGTVIAGCVWFLDHIIHHI